MLGCTQLLDLTVSSDKLIVNRLPYCAAVCHRTKDNEAKLMNDTIIIGVKVQICWFLCEMRIYLGIYDSLKIIIYSIYYKGAK